MRTYQSVFSIVSEIELNTAVDFYSSKSIIEYSLVEFKNLSGSFNV